MAVKKIQSISSIKNPHTSSAKTLGYVKTYNGIYEAVVVNAEDVQKNGRLTVRLLGSNVGVSGLPDSMNKTESHLNLIVRWSSPFAGATNIHNTIK